MDPIVTWATGLLLTVAAVALLRPLAPRIGLIDRPSARKNHSGDVPLVGGLAIAFALLFALGMSGEAPGGWILLAAGVAALLIGLWDDVSKVSSGTRLLLQAAAVCVLAFGGGVVLRDLGHLGLGGESLRLAWLAVPFTVFAGVGVINAVNMSDGMDGLCSMLSLVALVGLGMVAAQAGRGDEFMLIAALAGAIVGFLAFNFRFPGRRQATAFLGDGGSYLIGILFVYLTVRLSQRVAGEAAPPMSPVTALWFLMVPLLDTVGMILRRLHRGRSPFAADREHLHHVFLLARFTVTETVLIISGIALGGVMLGLGGLYLGVPESLMLAAFLAVGVGYYWMIMRAWKVMRFLSRSINRRMGRDDRRVIADRRRRNDPSVVARLGYERRSGLDRRRGHKDRRSRAAQPVSGTALQHRDYAPGRHARERTERAG